MGYPEMKLISCATLPLSSKELINQLDGNIIALFYSQRSSSSSLHSNGSRSPFPSQRRLAMSPSLHSKYLLILETHFLGDGY